LNNATLFGPELVQRHDNILKIHIAADSFPCSNSICCYNKF
jgi:hypothetical protein